LTGQGAEVFVEVLHRQPGSGAAWTGGSGLVISTNLVLTAAHVVGDGTVLIRVDAAGERRGHVVWRGDPESVDLALVAFDGPPVLSRPWRFGVVDRARAELVTGCRAVGFPAFKPQRGRPLRRASAQVDGVIPTAENLGQEVLTLRMTAVPKELSSANLSPWAGMSGAAVFSGDVVIGVVADHVPSEGSSTLSIVPLTAVAGSADVDVWWDMIGVKQNELIRMPSRWHPAGHPVARELAPSELVGRDEELAALARFATGEESYRWVVGGPWTGKTALASTFAIDPPPKVDVIAYFMVRRAGDADVGRLLQSACAQLAELLGEPFETGDPETFRRQWASATARARATGRHLLLLVDGLDEDVGPAQATPSVAQLLPARVDAHAHVLLFSRRYPLLPSDVAADHPLRTLGQDELRPSGVADQLRLRATQDLEQWLARGRSDPLLVDVLGLLTVARGALSVDDLWKLANGASRRDVRQLVERDVGRVLEPVGPPDAPRFLFAHDTLLSTAEAAFDPLELDAYHDRIWAWAWAGAERRWLADETAAYLFDGLPQMLITRAPARLADLYRDLDYVERANGLLGSVRLAADVHAGVTAVPGDRFLRDLALILDREAAALRELRAEPGIVIDRIALQAVRSGFHEIAAEARRRMKARRQPQLLPVWSDSNTPSGLIRVLEGHRAMVSAVAVTADGTRAVSTSFDDTIRVWDLATGDVRVVAGHATWGFGGISFDGDLAFIAGQQMKMLHVLNIVTGEAMGALDVAGTAARHGIRDIREMHFEPVNRRIACVGSDDSRIVWWNILEQRSHVLDGHVGRVYGLVVHPDEELILSAGKDGTLRFWDLSEGVADVRSNGGSALLGLCLSADGHVAVSWGEDFEFQVWDVRGRRLASKLDGDGHRPDYAALNRDGTVLISRDDETIRVWDLVAGRCVATVYDRDIVTEDWDEDASSGVLALSEDGRCAITTSHAHRLKVWQVDAMESYGPLLSTEVTKSVIGHGGPLVASAGWGTTIRAWNVADGSSFEVEHGVEEPIYAIALSNDGTLGVSSHFNDGQMPMWDPSSGKHLGWLDSPEQCPRVVAIDRHGAVVFASEEELYFQAPGDRGDMSWSVIPWEEAGLEPIIASADGKQIFAMSAEGELRSRDLQSGREMVIPGNPSSNVWGLATSANGHRAVAIDSRGVLQVWDLRAEVLEGQLEAGTSYDGDVAISPDGRLAFTLLGADTLRVWSIDERRCVATGHRLGRRLKFALCSSRPGRLELFVGDADATFTLYEVWEPPR
jgi:WD40 repeat protein